MAGQCKLSLSWDLLRKVARCPIGILFTAYISLPLGKTRGTRGIVAIAMNIPADGIKPEGNKVNIYAAGYTDDNADVELVSSDGMVFKVHSCHLMSASVFFRDLLGSNAILASGPRVVPLTDPTLETSASIADFLDCICGKDLFQLLQHYGRAKILIDLLDKYDCPAWLTICRRYVPLAAQRTPATSLPMFLLSAKLRDPLACKEIIALAGGRHYTVAGNAPAATATARQVVAGRSIMDISSFTESLLEDLPTKYILALVRGLAMRGDTSGQPGAGNWTAVADEFYRVVTS